MTLKHTHILKHAHINHITFGFTQVCFYIGVEEKKTVQIYNHSFKINVVRKKLKMQ